MKPIYLAYVIEAMLGIFVGIGCAWLFGMWAVIPGAMIAGLHIWATHILVNIDIADALREENPCEN